LEIARKFEAAGIKRLHLVDLDGARSKHIVNRRILETIAKETSLHVDFGGGVQSDADIQLAFKCGASQVTGGSIAVKNPGLFEDWLREYGSEKIILGADAKNRKIAIGGWEETTTADVITFIRNYVEKGVLYVICTDVAKDGLLQGPSISLYKEIMEEIPGIKLIASGGVSSMEDLEELKKSGVYGTIVGKAFYEGKISLGDLASLV
jgi:phosphoribosylformimino-5-aminoimidazole carboxamide ribotide isomerase